jgi:predicted ATPase/DNA-binding SARP family transcriptional activator/Tfp pilus assembly protein PilF
MSNVRLSVFGTPRIEIDGSRVEPGRRKSTALFIYLAVTQRHHSRETLTALLFPESDEDRARAGLRRILASLKAVLPDGWLESDRELIGLKSIPHFWVDLRRFYSLLDEIRVHEHYGEGVCDTCISLLSEGVQLVQDDFLKGFNLADCPDFDAWVYTQQELLRQAFGGALERLSYAYCERGDFEKAITYSLRQLQLDPFQEATHRQLMRLYEWSGRRADAIRQFAVCESMLVQIGTTPDEETCNLVEQIRCGKPPAWQGVPRTSSAANRFSPSKDLPVQSTVFTGRAAEVAILMEHLATPGTRLITLLGPGGIGKTRLALHVGELASAQFTHGVYFVPLTAVGSSTFLVSAVANALHFTFYDQGDPRIRLFHYLSDKHLLLILDNFEHLLDAAPFLSELLVHAPNIKVLCTSRERLHVSGETVIPVLGLDYPRAHDPRSPDQYDAVKLFQQSALHVRPGFDISLEQDAVARICQIVQGIPLALDLAAGWLTFMSPSQIADRLAGSFDLLTSNAQDLPLRHRHMRTVIEESWHVLSADEQNLLLCLSYANGGFSLEIVEHLVPNALPALASLTSKALVRLDAAGRYSFHELLRQYAAEQLSRKPDLVYSAHERFAHYYAQWLSGYEAALHSHHQKEARAAIAIEMDNIRSVWNWASDKGRADLLNTMLVTLDRYYEACGALQERAEAFTRALTSIEGNADHRQVVARLRAFTGKALVFTEQREAGYRALRISIAELDTAGTNLDAAFAMIALAYGLIIYERQYEEAEKLLQLSLEQIHGLEAYSASEAAADALLNLGRIYGYTGRYDEARAAYEQSLAIGQQVGNPLAVAEALSSMGVLALIREQFDEAKSWLEEAITLNQRYEHKLRTVRDLHRLGVISMRQGKYTESVTYLENALTLYRGLGDRKSESACLIALGVGAYYGKSYDVSLHYYRVALAMAREIGDQEAVANCLSNIAIIYWEQGHSFTEAKRLTQESLAIHRANGFPALVATTLASLGIITFACDEPEEAYAALWEAIQIGTAIEQTHQVLSALSFMPFVLARFNEFDLAYRVYQVIVQYPDMTTDHEIWRRQAELFTEILPLSVRAQVDGQDSLLTLEAVIDQIRQRPPQ